MEREPLPIPKGVIKHVPEVYEELKIIRGKILRLIALWNQKHVNTKFSRTEGTGLEYGPGNIMVYTISRDIPADDINTIGEQVYKFLDNIDNIKCSSILITGTKKIFDGANLHRSGDFLDNESLQSFAVVLKHALITYRKAHEDIQKLITSLNNFNCVGIREGDDGTYYLIDKSNKDYRDEQEAEEDFLKKLSNKSFLIGLLGKKGYKSLIRDYKIPDLKN